MDEYTGVKKNVKRNFTMGGTFTHQLCSMDNCIPSKQSSKLKTMLDKLKAFLNHERYQVIAVLVALCICLWIYGCESKTMSPTDPTQKISRKQLAADIDYYLAKAEIAYKDLDQQDEIKQKLMDAAAIAAQGGRINVVGLILTNLGILGAGATIDRVRTKRKNAKVDHQVIDHGVNV